MAAVAWNGRDSDDEDDSPAEVVGTIASVPLGAIHVHASPGAVTLARRGETLGLSPRLARSLSCLLSRAADVAECVCVVADGKRLRNPACAVHGRGRQ